MAKKKYYVNSKELEEFWTGWLVTGCDIAWEQMSSMIYRMCEGIATKFNPSSEEEHTEHAHDAFIMTMDKIMRGKLRFDPGRAPVFNLLTTTIFRHLYSKMNKQKRHRQHHAKYVNTYVSENHPDLLPAVRRDFEITPT